MATTNANAPKSAPKAQASTSLALVQFLTSKELKAKQLLSLSWRQLLTSPLT